MTIKPKEFPKKVQNILKLHSVAMNVVEFNETNRTSQDAAKALGCEVGQLAKTLIFRGKSSLQPICIIASGNNKIDEKKLEMILGERVEKPEDEFILKHTSYAAGGIPPVGFSLKRPPLIDEDLMAYSEIWATAGSPFSVFKLTPKDLLKITEGNFIKLKKEPVKKP